MPWKDTNPMEERLKFISMYLSDEWSMSELCRSFGISRKTGYKWYHRYGVEGLDGLKERSRASHRHPNAVSTEIEALVVALRHTHPRWGPKKLRALLKRQGCPSLPAESTIAAILKRHGLVVSRRCRRKTPPYEAPFLGCEGANAVWSADLKGWFRTQDGVRCDPLTITDNYSRYLLRCQAVPATDYTAFRPVFEAAFREYGLPLAIRTDNGPPFATTTVGGLSRLSIWWLKLGITVERIDPGTPSQNGRHERMHRTLKQETAAPPRANQRCQQAAFDRFRQEYNYVRPHEGIGQKTPANQYRESPRKYPLLVEDMTYPNNWIRRYVKSQGDISWKNRHVYLSKTLAGESVGLKQIDDDLWDIYFGPIRLAKLDTASYRLIHLTRKQQKTKKTK